jgi:hypothetical protein
MEAAPPRPPGKIAPAKAGTLSAAPGPPKAAQRIPDALSGKCPPAQSPRDTRVPPVFGSHQPAGHSSPLDKGGLGREERRQGRCAAVGQALSGRRRGRSSRQDQLARRQAAIARPKLWRHGWRWSAGHPADRTSAGPPRWHGVGVRPRDPTPTMARCGGQGAHVGMMWGYAPRTGGPRWHGVGVISPTSWGLAASGQVAWGSGAGGRWRAERTWKATLISMKPNSSSQMLTIKASTVSDMPG